MSTFEIYMIVMGVIGVILSIIFTAYCKSQGDKDTQYVLFISLILSLAAGFLLPVAAVWWTLWCSVCKLSNLMEKVFKKCQ